MRVAVKRSLGIVLTAAMMTGAYTGVYASENVYDSVMKDFDALSLNTDVITKASDLTLPTVGAEGSSITWSVESETIPESLVISDNAIESITRQKGAIDWTFAEDGKYTANTGKVMAAAQDSFVTLNAKIQKGNAVLNKVFTVIVKKDPLQPGNLFVDNFEQGINSTVSGNKPWSENTVNKDYTAEKGGNASAHKVRYHYESEVTDAEFGTTTKSTKYTYNPLPNTALAGHVQAAGMRFYYDEFPKGAAQNFILQNGAGKEFSFVRIQRSDENTATLKVSDGTGKTAEVSFPENIATGKWYQLEVVADFGAEEYFDENQSAYYDVYLYEYDYETDTKTYLNKLTGLKQATANSELIDPSKKYIKYVQTDPYQSNVYYDDIYVTDFTTDVQNAKKALEISSEMRSGTKLPLKGTEETKIAWTASSPNVAISEDGTITIPKDTTAENITLTAEITKQDTDAAKETKSFIATINNETLRELTDPEKIKADFDLLTFTKDGSNEVDELSDFVGDGTLPVIGENGSSISWQVVKVDDENGFAMTDNQITTFVRPDCVVDNSTSEAGEYTDTTGRVLSSANDNAVTVKATISSGTVSVTKMFDIVIKRNENASLSNLYLNNFDHESMDKWSVRTNNLITSDTVDGNVSKKIKYTYIDKDEVYGSAGFNFVHNGIKYENDISKHVLSAGFRYYINAVSGDVINLKIGTSNATTAFLRTERSAGLTKLKASVDGSGDTSKATSFTYIQSVNGGDLLIPNEKWIQIETVIDYSGNYVPGTNNSSYYDVYVYEYDYVTGVKTLIGKSTKLTASVNADEMPSDDTLYISNLSVEGYKINAYIDDIFVTDLTADAEAAGTALTIPNVIETGYVLPNSGINGTDVNWSVNSAGAEIVDGVLNTTVDIDNAELIATITKGEADGILTTVTKKFNVSLRAGEGGRAEFDIIDTMGNNVTVVEVGTKVRASYIGTPKEEYTGLLAIAIYNSEGRLIGVNLTETEVSRDITEYETDEIEVTEDTAKISAFLWEKSKLEPKFHQNVN